MIKSLLLLFSFFVLFFSHLGFTDEPIDYARGQGAVESSTDDEFSDEQSEAGMFTLYLLWMCSAFFSLDLPFPFCQCLV